MIYGIQHICFVADVDGKVIGTALMKRMLSELKQRVYQKTSLSVQKANYAVKMYQNVGFVFIDEQEEEYSMVCDLSTL